MYTFKKSLEGQGDQSEAHNSTAHSWSEKFAQRVKKYGVFCGTVHCEASLMGAIVQYKSQANIMQNTELREIFCVSLHALLLGWPANHSFGRALPTSQGQLELLKNVAGAVTRLQLS